MTQFFRKNATSGFTWSKIEKGQGTDSSTKEIFPEYDHALRQRVRKLVLLHLSVDHCSHLSVSH